MEEGKSSKSIVSAIIIVLLIVVIALLGVMVYKLYTDNQALEAKVNKLSENTVATDTTSSEPEETESIDVGDALVSKLYNYVLKSDKSDASFAWESGAEPASFYRSSKVTYASLSDMEKTLVVIDNYSANEIKTVKTSTLEGIIDTDIKLEDTKVFENVNDKAKSIFNHTESKWGTFEGLSTKLEYNGGNYYQTSFYGGGKGTSEHGYAELVRAEKSGNEIYLYDKFIYVDATLFDISEGDKNVHVYSTSDKTEEIGDATGSDNTISVANLFKKYESKLNTFKHTFKQAQDGTYYWVSTEIAE